MTSESTSKTSPLLCMTCSKTIKSEKEINQSIIHSCCSKPVCSTCLQNRPRLATFCVFCEGVQHALRKKGPRDDVIRAGQTFFDLDKYLDQDEKEGDDEISSSPQQQIPPPPAYSQSSQDPTFVVGGEEENAEEEIGNAVSVSYPNINRMNVERSSAINGRIDPNQLANGVSTINSSSSSPLRDSLQNALDSKTIDSHNTTRQSANRSKIDQFNSRQLKENKCDSNDPLAGLTRQYWLRPNDTLMSISLRFRVSTTNLCKLNGLPISTATSTPHLIHTRSFLLIPEESIKFALQNSPEDSNLNLALTGPAPMNRQQKLQRNRKEAQSKFRSLVLQNESKEKKKKNGTETVCDDRAAKAYISLMESELQFIDFGDGIQADSDETVEIQKANIAADDEALIDSGRQRRYDEIVKQALCKWEMDSDWERQQRAMGLEPHSSICTTNQKTRNKTTASSSSWLGWLNGESSQSKAKLGSDSTQKCQSQRSEKLY